MDLAVHSFEHYSDHGDLWHLLEPSELISGHGQVGAWGLVEVMAVNINKFVIEVALELACPSLRVELIVVSSLG